MSRRAIGEPLFRILAPLLGVLLVLAVLEVGLRLAGYDPIRRYTKVRDGFLRESANPDLDYELVPGAQGFAWGTQVAVNAHGFRDREYPIAKAPGTRRIVVIGDSIAFGTFLEPEQTFPKRLEARFAGAGAPVEVLNLAIAGYDIVNEVAFLEQAGLAFSPDDVVVGFCINDVGLHSGALQQIRLLREYGRWIGRFRVLQLLSVRAGRTLLARDLDALNEESEFRRRNAGKIASLADDPEALARIRRLESSLAAIRTDAPLRFLAWYASEAKIGRLRYAFDRLRRLSLEHGFEVALVIVPYLDERGHADAYAEAYAIVAHEAARAGFRVLDVEPSFRGRGLAALQIVRGGVPNALHPNARGHDIIAERLFEALSGP